MVINHNAWGSKDECLQKRPSITENVMSAIISLIDNMSLMHKFELEMNQELSEAVSKLKAICKRSYNDFSEVHKYVSDINLLWESYPIQETYARGNEFQLPNNAFFFLTKIQDIFSPDYIPTNQDVLHINKPSSGIKYHSIELKCSDDCDRCKKPISYLQLVNSYDLSYIVNCVCLISLHISNL